MAQSRTPSPFSLVLTVLLALAGFVFFIGLALVILKIGNDRPTFEMKRQEERLTKLRTHEAKDKELLETYGWVNESEGIARLPIERAMGLTLVDLEKKEVKSAGPVVPVASTEQGAPSAEKSPSDLGSPSSTLKK